MILISEQYSHLHNALEKGNLESEENKIAVPLIIKRLTGRNDGANVVYANCFFKKSETGKPLIRYKRRSHSPKFFPALYMANIHPDIDQRLRLGRIDADHMKMIEMDASLFYPDVSVEDMGPLGFFTNQEADEIISAIVTSPSPNSHKHGFYLSFLMEYMLMQNGKPIPGNATRFIKSEILLSWFDKNIKINAEEEVFLKNQVILTAKFLMGALPWQALSNAMSMKDVNRSDEWFQIIKQLPTRSKTVSFDIKNFERGINEGHYGMEDVKNVLTQEAAYIKKGLKSGSTICLVGSPGVGKTTIAQSFAELIGQPSFIISLAAAGFDVSYLTGFQPSWSGSAPGALIKGLIGAESRNAVVILDEIDKLQGGMSRGNASSALLMMLDPSQRQAFMDNFLGFPYDISNITFIATANYPDRIAPELIDRLRILNVPSYSNREKVQIGMNHILPSLCKNAQIDPKDSGITEEMMDIMVNRYTKEAGCRSLSKKIEDVIRDGVLTGERNESSYEMNEERLKEILGRPISDRAKAVRPGVVNGLSVSAMGGSLLPIEAVISSSYQDDGQSLIMERDTDANSTGNLQRVMMESIRVAKSAVSYHAKNYGIASGKDVRNAHVHANEGAIPKDGPSAGVAISLALISALTKTPPIPGLAVTGEISLYGDVMPVGGIRDKVFGAIREGMNTVILPDANRHDADKIPEIDRPGVRFIFVKRLEEAVEAAFGGKISYEKNYDNTGNDVARDASM